MQMCKFLKSLSLFTTFQEATEVCIDQNKGANQERSYGVQVTGALTEEG